MLEDKIRLIRLQALDVPACGKVKYLSLPSLRRLKKVGRIVSVRS